MGGRCSTIQLEEADLSEIQEETGFAPAQINRLYSRFSALDKGNFGKLRREDFLRIPELAINPLGERIVDSFFEDVPEDEEVDAGVNFRQFIRTLAFFRPEKRKAHNPLSDREHKLQFAFKIYDMDGDGYISRDELLTILQMMVGVSIGDDQLGSIADRAISETDGDRDGYISFEEFAKIMDRTDFQTKMSIRFLS